MSFTHSLYSVLELIQRGGLMMVPLLVALGVGIFITLERFVVLHFYVRVHPDDAQKALTLLQSEAPLPAHNDTESPAISQSRIASQLTHSPFYRLALIRKQHLQSTALHVRELLQHELSTWDALFENRLILLDTIITAAPLMGLLGTITGMIGSFRVLSEKGINEPNAITGGVAEALIATATGIVVALLCLGAYNYFTRRIQVIQGRLGQFCDRLLMEGQGFSTLPPSPSELLK